MSKSKVVDPNAASKSIVAANLSTKATSILVKNLSTKTIQGATGPDLNSLDVADEVTLGLLILDESGSMTDDEQTVRSEVAANLDAIKKSKQAPEILLSSWAFSDRPHMIHSYLTLDLADPLSTYHPGGSTALFDTVLDALTSLIQYETELKNQGMRVKLNVTVVTDGDDNASRASAGDVKNVVEDIRQKRENATFNLIALGNQIDETTLAGMMGFPDPSKFDKTPAGMRRAWGTWSSSVIRTSQTKINTKGSSTFLAQP